MYMYNTYIKGFPYWGDGRSPPNRQKFAHPLLPHQIFIPSLPKVNSTQ